MRRPENYGRDFTLGQWSWTDAVSSWSWNTPAGSPMILEVYTDAPEVELQLNGRAVARAATGERRPFVADFEIPYEPGTLTAVALKDGAEVSRAHLTSASDDVVLDVRPDKTSIELTDGSLAFLEIERRDVDGNLVNDAERPVTVKVSGEGSLAAFGSGRPATTEKFNQDTHGTYVGRVLAVIRPDGVGRIECTVTAPDVAPVVVSLEVVAPRG